MLCGSSPRERPAVDSDIKGNLIWLCSQTPVQFLHYSHQWAESQRAAQWMSQPGAQLASGSSLSPGRQTWDQTAQLAPKYYENNPWKPASSFSSTRSCKSQEQSSGNQSELGFALGSILCFGHLFRRKRFFTCLLKIKSWERSSFLMILVPCC